MPALCLYNNSNNSSNNNNNNNNDNNNSNYNNNNDNNDDNNDNSLYLKRVIQSNGKDLPWGPLACLQVARGPQALSSTAFRYRDLKAWSICLMMTKAYYHDSWCRLCVPVDLAHPKNLD